MSASGGALSETSRELAAGLETKRLEQGAKVAIDLNGYNNADTAIGRLIRDADAAQGPARGLFNRVTIVADPGADRGSLLAAYSDAYPTGGVARLQGAKK